jgi:hypothetical protein
MLILFNSAANSQDKKIGKQFKNRFSFSIGMGISMSTSPSFVDYIRNDVPFSNKDSVKAFGVGLEFFGGLDYDISKNFSIKLDYSYFIKSLTYNYSYFTYDYFYSIHQPYLMGFYVIRGETYQLKFGGGLGYHFAQMKKDIGASSDLIYNASGLGYRAQVEFIAGLSKKMNSYVSGFINGSSIGTLKDLNKNPLKITNTNEEVNLGGFGIGIRLGLSYYIN